MTLINYIIQSEKSKLETFNKDIFELLEFFEPAFNELKNKLIELWPKKPKSRWDDNENIYKTNDILINPIFINIQDNCII